MLFFYLLVFYKPRFPNYSIFLPKVLEKGSGRVVFKNVVMAMFLKY